MACLECGRVVDEKSQGNRSQLPGAGVGGVAVVVGLTRLRSCSRSERLACSSFASRCGFGLFDYQGTLFQGGLGLVFVLVWGLFLFLSGACLDVAREQCSKGPGESQPVWMYTRQKQSSGGPEDMPFLNWSSRSGSG